MSDLISRQAAIDARYNFKDVESELKELIKQRDSLNDRIRILRGGEIREGDVKAVIKECKDRVTRTVQREYCILVNYTSTGKANRFQTIVNEEDGPHMMARLKKIISDAERVLKQLEEIYEKKDSARH